MIAATAPGFLTPPQFAKRAGVSVKSVYTYLESGRLAAVKNQLSGRLLIPESELDRIFTPVGFAPTPPPYTSGDGRPNPLHPSLPPVPPTGMELEPTILTNISAGDVTPAETVKATILHAIDKRHGTAAASKLEAGWSPAVDEMIEFVAKMPGGINLEKLATTTGFLPADALNYPPVTWLTSLVGAAYEPLLAPPPTPPVKKEEEFFTPPPPVAAPRDVAAHKPGRKGRARVARTLPAPAARRQHSERPEPVVLPERDAGVCAICNAGTGHAAGCPQGAADEAARRHADPNAAARFRSPQAEAAAAQAYTARLRRQQQEGGDGDSAMALPAGFSFCTDEDCTLPFHRYVQLPGRADWFLGHLERDVERAREVEARATMAAAGRPPQAAPPPEAPPPAPAPTRQPAKSKKKKGK